MAVRVFIVDDHEVVRMGVRGLLEEHDDLVVVGEASNGAEALARIPSVRPDVAVLDARLPDATGAEICRELHLRHADVQCLILTAFADDEMLFNAIKAGAAGYVLKQTAGRALVDAVRVVAAGKSLLDPTTTRTVLERLRSEPRDGEGPGGGADPLARLSGQQLQILNLIAEGRTNKEIAERLYLAEKTVKNYVSTLLTKLGMQRRSQAAAYIVRFGDRLASHTRG